MAIHKFTRMINNNEPITMYGDGNSSRDYTYIDDIINGIILAMKNIDGYWTYNLGNNDPVKLIDLVNLIGNKLGKTPKIIYSEWQKGDVDHTLSDISLAKSELGYQAKTCISEGISKFIDWFLQKYNIFPENANIIT